MSSFLKKNNIKWPDDFYSFNTLTSVKKTTARQQRLEKNFGEYVCVRTRHSGDRTSWGEFRLFCTRPCQPTWRSSFSINDSVKQTTNRSSRDIQSIIRPNYLPCVLQSVHKNIRSITCNLTWICHNDLFYSALSICYHDFEKFIYFFMCRINLNSQFIISESFHSFQEWHLLRHYMVVIYTVLTLELQTFWSTS